MKSVCPQNLQILLTIPNVVEFFSGPRSQDDGFRCVAMGCCVNNLSLKSLRWVVLFPRLRDRATYALKGGKRSDVYDAVIS